MSVVAINKSALFNEIREIASSVPLGFSAVLVAGSEKIRKELAWQPQYEKLETIIETTWRWHQREVEGMCCKSAEME